MTKSNQNINSENQEKVFVAKKDFTFTIKNPVEGAIPEFVTLQILAGQEFSESGIPKGQTLDNLKTEGVI